MGAGRCSASFLLTSGLILLALTLPALPPQAGGGAVLGSLPGPPVLGIRAAVGLGSAHPIRAGAPASPSLLASLPTMGVRGSVVDSTPGPTGGTTEPVGNGPVEAVLDAATGIVYVVNEGSNNVSLINGTRPAGTVAVGNGPSSLMYDPASAQVYVVNAQGDNVSVIQGRSVIGAPSVGYLPGPSVYDPSDGFVYVPCDDNNSLVAINGTRIVGILGGLQYPFGSAYDPAGEDVYVADAGGGGGVSVVRGTSVIANVSAPGSADHVTYDSFNGFVYASGESLNGSGRVTVINGTQAIRTVTVESDPGIPAVDSRTGLVYVPNEGSATVSVLNGSRVVATVEVGEEPASATYDAGTGLIYVANTLSDDVSVLSGTQVVGSVSVGIDPVSVLYNPENGYLYVVNDYSDNVSVLYTPYAVTFSEHGLPPGETWQLRVAGGPLVVANTTSLTFLTGNGSHSYTLDSLDTEYASPSGTFTVNGSAVARSADFSLVTYPLRFVEMGLPAGTSWSVELAGQLESAVSGPIGFAEANGSYPFRLGGVPGWTTANFSSLVRVAGGPAVRVIDWSPSIYTIVFAEAGLPVGSWGLDFGGFTVSSEFSTISFSRPNGSYTFDPEGPEGWSAPAGTVNLSGKSLDVPVNFTAVSAAGPFYPVVFEEVGLPVGTSWSVGLAGTPLFTTANSVAALQPNGSYSFWVNPTAGFTASPGSGVAWVNGSGTTEPITFVPVPPERFPITFVARGLPEGLTWSVTIGGVEEAGSGNLTFPGFPNGTLSYSITPEAGFVVSPARGTFDLSGPRAPIVIEFQSSMAHSTFLGLPSIEGEGALAGVAIGAVLAGLWITVSRGRGRDRRGS